MEGLQDLRSIASAPGKVILFGEHAVVYGHPAVAASIDQRTKVAADVVGTKFTVNGHRLHEYYHAYIKTAVDRFWKGDPVRIQTDGGVPSASGTGSSAALTVATVACLRRLLHEEGLPGLAQWAFETERATQGGGSPTDTSVSTAGGCIAIGGERPGVGEPLWDLNWEERQWSVERIRLPSVTAVIGNSGVKGRTDAEVAKVAHNIKRNPLVRDTLDDIGRIARDAVKPLEAGDWEQVGRLMDKQHGAMHTIGVNHVAVQKLVDAVRQAPGTWGAKITGAGGGGSMVCLSDKPGTAAKAIREAGGTAYVVGLGGPGVQWHEP